MEAITAEERESQEPVYVLECEGCGVFFSCNCTRNGHCDGIKLYKVTDTCARTKEEVDLSTFEVKYHGLGCRNVSAFDKQHIYDLVIESKCYCNKCSNHTAPDVSCGDVETINWEHRPVKKFKLGRRWTLQYDLLEAYTQQETLKDELKESGETIERLKEALSWEVKH